MKGASYVKGNGEINKNKLAVDLKIAPSNVKRWLDGDTTPAGDTLERLCAKLRVSPAFLFGTAPTNDQAAETEKVIADAERVLGLSMRDVVRSLLSLTPHHRSLAVASLQGWIHALRQIELTTGKMPLTQFEIDEAELRAAAGVTASERSVFVGPSR